MTETRNPYAPPTATVADREPEFGRQALIPNGQLVPAGHGVRWLRDAWRLYLQEPWRWIGVMLLLILLSICTAIIPFSNFVTTILWPVFCGGLMLAANVQRQSGTFTIGSVFAGFGPRFAPLAIVGAVTLLVYPVMYLSILFFVGSEVAGAMVAGGTDIADPTPYMTREFLLAMLVYLLVALPIGAATFFAPALIMLHDLKPADAMKMSFVALLKNILPGLVFGIAMLCAFVISALPFGLGLLVTIPIAMISIYTMYRDVFVASA